MRPLQGAHPFLFAVFPVLFLFAHNVGQLAWAVAVPPLLATLCAAAAVWGGLRRALKDPSQAAVLTSVLLIWFFSYGAFHDLCFLHLRMHAALLLPLWGMLLLGAGVAVRRARGGLSFWNRLLTVFGVTLTGMSLVTALTPSLHAATRQGAPRPTLGPARMGARPDIYYIVLDSYAGEHTLEEFYHFHDDAFLRYLRGKGFYVADQSRSNYAFTLPSMSSALSMDYLTSLEGRTGPDAVDLSPLWARIETNPVRQALEADGYDYHHLGFQPGQQFHDFSYLLLKTTPLCYLYDRLVLGDSRRMTLSTLRELEAMPRSGRPVFVYAHILCPHEPFVFGPDGRPPDAALLARGQTDRETRKRLYVGQMAALNGMVERTLDHILAHSAAPPIILLQADHGPRNLAPDTPSPLCVAERMRILNAYYLPGRKARGLYPRITPVNSFRVIFNDYFGGHYPLLPDHSYFSTYAAPYAFVNVSGLVRDQYPVGWDQRGAAAGSVLPASQGADPD